MKRGILVALGLAALTAVGATVARAIEYDGAAKPGVRVLGIDVGGKSRTEIEAALAAWARRPVTIRAAGRSYHVPRAGSSRSTRAPPPLVRLLPARPSHSSCRSHAGRAGARAGRWRGRRAARDRTRRASCGLGFGDASWHDGRRAPAQIGRQLDRDALLDLLAGDATTIDAPFSDVRPPILDPAARSAASTARVLLDQPVALAYHGARLGSLTTDQLARSLRIRARKHRYAVAFDPESLARLVRLASVAGSSARTTRSSRSPASASTSFRRAPAATSTQLGSPRPSRRPRTTAAQRRSRSGRAIPT